LKKIDALLDKVRPQQMEDIEIYLDYGDGEPEFYAKITVPSPLARREVIPWPDGRC